MFNIEYVWVLFLTLHLYFPFRRGIHGMFPLHLAVLYGFSDCCRKLLSSGSASSSIHNISGLGIEIKLELNLKMKEINTWLLLINNDISNKRCISLFGQRCVKDGAHQKNKI